MKFKVIHWTNDVKILINFDLNSPIKKTDVEFIINELDKRYYVKGYKFISILTIGNSCSFLFKKKNYLEKLFKL
jgi:hypothetical protein